MADRDTRIGTGSSRFRTTSLATVAGGRLREHLEAVCRKYWRPVYFFIRRVWSKSNEEAKDLTQAFFGHVVENDVLARFDPARGNFRAFLKTCLRNFLSVDARDAGRLKRGGGVRFVSIEEWKEVFAETIPDGAPPEEAFDREWLTQVVRDAIAELEERMKAAVIETFRLHDLADGEVPTYEETAKVLGLTVSDVGNHLRAARRELRSILLRRLAEYVSDEEEILMEEERLTALEP